MNWGKTVKKKENVPAGKICIGSKVNNIRRLSILQDLLFFRWWRERAPRKIIRKIISWLRSATQITPSLCGPRHKCHFCHKRKLLIQYWRMKESDRCTTSPSNTLWNRERFPRANQIWKPLHKTRVVIPKVRSLNPENGDVVRKRERGNRKKSCLISIY